MTLFRNRIVWSNFEGAPGYSVLHYEMAGAGDDYSANIAEAADLLFDGFTSIRPWLLNGVSLSIDTEWLQITPSNGKLEKVHYGPAWSPLTGTGIGSALPRATMATVRHLTDGIRDGRRINGRTFLGPLSENAIDSSGHVESSARAAFASMWDGLQDTVDTRLMVYARQRYSASNPPVAQVDGTAAHVQSSVCNVLPGGLRSRRE